MDQKIYATCLTYIIEKYQFDKFTGFTLSIFMASINMAVST
jgi:hypothetical protein